MFRYKANLASKTLTEEHSKITRLSSGDSSSSKEGMDPGKDSWVFSKDSPSSRKHREMNRRRESSIRVPPSNDDDVYSVKSDETPPINENMKVNVLYRGMVYRIRGIKIICSVFAGIVLLLAAVVILGIWIVLGASEDGKFYFPWNDSASEAHVNKSTEHASFDFNSKLANLTKKGGFMVSLEREVLLPDDVIYEDDINYRLPSEEVGEALGHLQAMHPRPLYPTTPSDERTTTGDSEQTTYDDEYYEDYDEYYADDGDVQYSFQHETIANPPPDFVGDQSISYEDNDAIIDSEENNFRVRINGNDEIREATQYTHLIKPGELLNSKNRDGEVKNEFRPSPRIPDSSPDYTSDSRFIESRRPEMQDLTFEERKDIGRPFINGQTIQNHDEHVTYINDQVGSPNKHIIATDYNDHVVEYGDVLIAKTTLEEPMYFNLKSEEYQSKDMSYQTPARQDEEINFEVNDDKDYQTETFISNPLPRHQLQPLTKEEYIEEEEEEDDPHRSLFVGNYDGSQIILEEDPFMISERQQSVSLPYFNGGLPARQLARGQSQDRMPFSMRPRFPMPHRPVNRNRPIMRSHHPFQQHMRPPPPPSSRRRPVPGTVHPIPNVRRSHITAGFRPRISKTNMDFLRRQDLKNSNVAARAEQYADSAIAESITYPTIVRRDGTLVYSRMPIAANSLKSQSNSRFPPQEFSDQQRFPPFRNEQPEANGFLDSLKTMYDYSTKIAGSLLSFPNEADLDIANSTTDFLKNSFGLLTNYDDVFRSLPQVFMEPLQQFQLPTGDEVEQLDPFELSLMTWTFIDFWEFLIEKVGSLSKEDLRVLETRLEKIRQQKDNSMARAFIGSIPDSINETNDEHIETAVKTFELSLNGNNTANINTQKTSEANLTKIDHLTSNDTTIPIQPYEGGNELAPNDIFEKARESIITKWDPLGIFTNEERNEFMKYTIHTLFNFGKVYLRSDYALDCMMLLFCKDINSNTKQEGMGGIAAKLKSVGLKVLTDKEGRETDTIKGVWEALTQWTPLECDSMFPKCDGSKALEIVNEVANASRK